MQMITSGEILRTNVIILRHEVRIKLMAVQELIVILISID